MYASWGTVVNVTGTVVAKLRGSSAIIGLYARAAYCKRHEIMRLKFICRNPRMQIENGMTSIETLFPTLFGRMVA